MKLFLQVTAKRGATVTHVLKQLLRHPLHDFHPHFHMFLASSAHVPKFLACCARWRMRASSKWLRGSSGSSGTTVNLRTKRRNTHTDGTNSTAQKHE